MFNLNIGETKTRRFLVHNSPRHTTVLKQLSNHSLRGKILSLLESTQQDSRHVYNLLNFGKRPAYGWIKRPLWPWKMAPTRNNTHPKWKWKLVLPTSRIETGHLTQTKRYTLKWECTKKKKKKNSNKKNLVMGTLPLSGRPGEASSWPPHLVSRLKMCGVHGVHRHSHIHRHSVVFNNRDYTTILQNVGNTLQVHTVQYSTGLYLYTLHHLHHLQRI
jgi:hypothetical protein